MAIEAVATVDGRTLQEFLVVTRKDLAARMDSKMLLAAAQDAGKKTRAWIEQAKWDHLSDGVADHVCSFLEENLISVFAGAWAKFTELKKCAQETRKSGTTMDVSLADHDFTYEIKPHIDVLLNGKKVTEIPLKIDVSCEVKGLELFLKAGCVYQVRSGKCDCTAEIRIAENLVWSRKIGSVNLPGELHLSKPIPLDTPQERKSSIECVGE